ncbi:MAG: DUF3108 domain-containing protein [Cohaesibacter sp.]|jgi:hypothetical protein|nr:DUF3108 domain-containing protein [Cohaesibacter sp.]
MVLIAPFGRSAIASQKAVGPQAKLLCQTKTERRITSAAFALAAAWAALVGVEQAQATEVKASFRMSIAGIPVGKGGVTATVKGRNYSIDGYAKTSGVSRMFVDSKGRAVSKGRFKGEKLMPSSYALNSRENKIRNVVQIAMRSGNVKDFTASPPVSKVKDRIPLKRVHTRGIVDPLSGLILSTKSVKHRVGKSVCNRTVRMFDGRWRYNIELYYKGTKNVKASSKDGYTGPVTRCGARLRFVAGHRPNKKSTKFMENNKDLEAWFVPVGNEPVVAVYRLQIGTMVGRLVLQAKRWQVN